MLHQCDGASRRTTGSRPAFPRAQAHAPRAGSILIRAAVLAAVVCGGPLALLHAQASKPATLTPEDRSYLEKAALGAARTALYDHVRGLTIDTSLTVGAWSGREVERDRALRKWIREMPNAGATRYYSDGTAEADLHFEPAELVDLLRGLARGTSSLGDGGADEAGKIAAGARDWKPQWFTGASSLAERGGPDKPPGWEDISFEGIQVVRRAARADAIRELVEVVGRLNITNARKLSEFVDAAPAIESALVAGLDRDATVTVEMAQDQVALATATIASNGLLRILNRIFQEQGASSGFSAEDFREMAVITQDQELRASGMASPPPKYRLAPAYRTIELDYPAWVDQTLRATGRFEPQEERPPDERARIGAARIDAIDQLRRQVELLPVLQEVTVEELLARRPELKDDVIVFLTGARQVGAPERLPDDGVAVQCELPLRKLWHILRRGIRTVEVEPAVAASQPTSRPALPPRNEKSTPRSAPPQEAGDAQPEKKP